MEYGRGFETLTACYYIFNQSSNFQLRSTSQTFKVRVATNFSAFIETVLAQAGLLFFLLDMGIAQHRS